MDLHNSVQHTPSSEMQKNAVEAVPSLYGTEYFGPELKKLGDLRDITLAPSLGVGESGGSSSWSPEPI